MFNINFFYGKENCLFAFIILCSLIASGVFFIIYFISLFLPSLLLLLFVCFLVNYSGKIVNVEKISIYGNEYKNFYFSGILYQKKSNNNTNWYSWLIWLGFTTTRRIFQIFLKYWTVLYLSAKPIGKQQIKTTQHQLNLT